MALIRNYRRLYRLLTFITLIVVIGLSGLLLYSRFFASKAEAAWYDETYGYRHRVTFTHNADISADRSVTFTLDTAELIAASEMQGDCDDTRFTDAHGNLLLYDLTGTCNNGTTTYEVIFPSVINGINLFYVYYGNGAAVNAEINSTVYTALTPSGGDPSLTNPTSSGNQESSPGPIAYWKLDEGTDNTCSGGTNDACNGMGNASYDGAKTSATWAPEDLCVSGKCVKFNGSFDRIITGARAVSDTFTLEAWVKRTANLTNNGACSSDQWYCGFGVVDMEVSGVVNDYGLSIKDNKAIFGVGNPDTSILSTTTLQQGVWYFLTATRNMSTGAIALYVNGQLENTGTANTNSLTAGSSTNIGNSGNTSGRSLTGMIDEAKVYNYIRTTSQIKSDYIKFATQKGSAAVLGGSVQNNVAALSDGLVAYWKLDENTGTTTSDSSGNNNTSSTFSNQATWTTGKYGTGIVFDGTDDAVFFPETTGTDLGATTDSYTVAAWFKTTGSGTLVAKRNGSTYPFRLISGGSNVSWIFSQSGTSTTTSGGSSLNDGNWHHAVGVRNVATDTSYLYADGVLVDSTTDTSAGSMTNDADVALGVLDSSFNNDYTGSIDDVRIYNRALSSSEVATLYNWAPSASLYWRFDERTGSNAYDSSTNDFTGSLTNATWGRGKYGNAVNFDGNGDYVRNSSVTINPSLPFTISAWMYTRDAVQADAYFELSSSTTCNGNPQLWVSNGAGGSVAGDLILGRCGSGPGPDLGAASGFVNSWNHITFAFDGTNTRAYKNGVLTDTYSFTWPSIATMRVTVGGSRENTPSLFMDGMFDDFKIYTYARTQKQVLQDYNAGHPSVGSPVGSAVGHWKFDEGANDTCSGGSNDACNSGSAGSALDGAITNATWTASGKFNKALAFDGSGDYVDMGSNAALNATGSFAISSWVYWNSLPSSDDVIVRKEDATAGLYLLGIQDSATNLIFRLDIGGSQYKATYAKSNLSATTWYHVSGIYSNTANTVTLYLNGKKVAQTSTSGTPAINDSNFIVGATAAGAESLNGRIDEVKFYNYDLTSDEVMVDYNRGSAIVMGVEDQGQNVSDGQGSGPVAYWDLNEKSGTTARDTSGTGMTGTLTTSPLWATGKFGSGIDLRPTSSYITVADNTVLNDTDDMTIEFWAKPVTVDGTSRIVIGKGNNAASTSRQYNIRINSSNQWESFLYSGSTTYSRAHTVITPTVGRWDHVVMVRRSNVLYTYVNGTKSSSGTALGGATNSTSNAFAIGREGVSSGAYFGGFVDEVKVYSYARTDAQIAFDYNKGAPIGWWKFDECQGATAYDSAPNSSGGFNGNNGTITPGAGSNTAVGTCGSGTSSEMWNDGTSGKFNASMGYDGSDDYVTVADPASGILDFVDGGDFSISAWVYTNAVGAVQTVVAKKTSNGAGTTGYLLNFTAGGKFNAYISDGTDQFFRPSSTTLSSNTWYHVVFVFDEDSSAGSIFYVNGAPDNGNATGTITDVNDISNSQPFVIGAESDFGSPFDGKIDDVRVYNYALSSAQVKLLMNDGSAVRFGPLTGSP